MRHSRTVFVFDLNRKGDDGKLLTSKETRQLRKEWLKRYNGSSGGVGCGRGGRQSDDDRSQYDNVPRQDFKTIWFWSFATVLISHLVGFWFFASSSTC